MAAFWKLADLKRVPGEAHVSGGSLTVRGTMRPLNNLEWATVTPVGKPHRRMPGGWPAQAAGVVVLAALAWACLMLFEVFEPIFWIGPALLVVLAGALALYGMRGVPCPPFAYLDIVSNSGYVVRLFAFNTENELGDLSKALLEGRRNPDHDFTQGLTILTNADDFCDVSAPSEKFVVVR